PVAYDPVEGGQHGRCSLADAEKVYPSDRVQFVLSVLDPQVVSIASNEPSQTLVGIEGPENRLGDLQGCAPYFHLPMRQEVLIVFDDHVHPPEPGSAVYPVCPGCGAARRGEGRRRDARPPPCIPRPTFSAVSLFPELRPVNVDLLSQPLEGGEDL